MAYTANLSPREDGFMRRKMSASDCRVLAENGLLDPEKYELIEGEIILKGSQGRLHIAVVTRLIAVLGAFFGGDAVQTHAQIGIGEIDEFNDPEPDVAVVRGSLRDHLEREPNPATEILLAVEAANTSLLGDTPTKARIYARQRIQEYWVVSIPHRQLIVLRKPEGEVYTDMSTYNAGEPVSPLAAPDARVQVADLLP
jgi:Uma2 family endonuclease